MLLKKVFNALNSSICISGSQSSNLHLTFHEILIPNNRSVWMRKGSHGWAFALLVIDLILSIFVRPFMHWMSYLHALNVISSCILCILHFFVCIAFVLILLLCFSFVWVKIQNHIKSEKFKKFDRICLSTYHMWVWPNIFVLMALCIYKHNLFFMHIYLCGKNLNIYVWSL